jgi:hypothetical protein
VRAGEDTAGQWIYPRGDLFRFRVVTPTGESHECAPERLIVTPIVDFFVRLSSRRGPTFAIEAKRICEPIFDRSGIYEVTPIVDLVYSGDAVQRDTVTGTFEGTPTPVRIRSGSGAFPAQPLP